MLEETSHVHYSDPEKQCAKTTEAEEPETVRLVEGSFKKTKQQQKNQNVSSEYCIIPGYVILCTCELTSPCPMSAPAGTISILQIENG